MTQDDNSRGWKMDRRSVLKKAGLASGALVLGTTVASGPAAAGIGDGRVLDYHLNNLHVNKDSGQKVKNFVHDASPAKNHGTNNGAEVVKGGAVGKAFAFDGTGDYIAVPEFPNITSSLTIAGWIQTSDPNKIGQRVFADDENNNGGYALSVGDGGTGTVRFYSRNKDSVILDTGDVIEAGNWYHVAGVYDGAEKNRRIYVDGQVEAEDTDDTGPWGTDSGTASVGGETDSGETSFRFSGLLDEVRVYDRALSSDEITELYEMRD